MEYKKLHYVKQTSASDLAPNAPCSTVTHTVNWKPIQKQKQKTKTPKLHQRYFKTQKKKKITECTKLHYVKQTAGSDLAPNAPWPVGTGQQVELLQGSLSTKRFALSPVQGWPSKAGFG